MRENAVYKIINEWDPICLMPHSPSDEYKEEIQLISELLKKVDNAELLAEGIYSIFIKQFGDDVFKKKLDDCLVIADKILNCC